MLIALIILGSIAFYAMMAGFCGTRHHNIAIKKCKARNHFDTSWCGHSCVSVWAAGLAWPFFLPVTIGAMLAGGSRPSKDERRREKEMAEAKHQLEITKLQAQEQAQLDRLLNKTEMR